VTLYAQKPLKMGSKYYIKFLNAKYNFFWSILINFVNVTRDPPLMNLNNLLLFFKKYVNRLSEVADSFNPKFDIAQAVN
jgi:hypothetical protein